MSSLGLQVTLDWALYVPLIGGLVAALIAWARQARAVPGKRAPMMRLLALVIASVTVLLEAGMLSIVPDGQSTTLFGLTFAMSVPARYVLTAANVALLCALIYGWLMVDEDDDRQTATPGALSPCVSPRRCWRAQSYRLTG